MAAMTAATGVAAALLLLLLLGRRAAAAERLQVEARCGSGEASHERREEGWRLRFRRRQRRQFRRPVEPPASWKEKVVLVAGIIHFTYSETFGKWALADLFFGIRHHIRRPGKLEISSVFVGSGCIELKGHGVLVDLIHMFRLLTLCFLFSKKPFPVLMESAGCTEEDILLKGPNSGLLKPAFTILRDRNSKSIFLVIRGALSIKDKLTAAAAELVPFQHLVPNDGCNSIMGYAHCGMVAAANWIAKCATPCLLQTVKKYPDYHLKIIGHSMGASVAALLSYVLRERDEFSSSTCVAFGPAACMTWDLAESGEHFVNATDLVPTFSAVSVNNLRAEIKESSWLTNHVQNTRLFNVLYRWMTTVRSCAPSVSFGGIKVPSASKFLYPTTKNCEVMIQHNPHAAIADHPFLSSWSFMAKRWPAITPHMSLDIDESADSILQKECETKSAPEKPVNGSTIDEDSFNHVLLASSMEGMPNRFLNEEENDPYKHDGGIRSLTNEKEENRVLMEAVEITPPMMSNSEEVHQLYPPGKLMHMVAVPALEFPDFAEDDLRNRIVGLYETRREMYGKIRLSQTMIDDHYLPRYLRMLQLVIEKLKRETSDLESDYFRLFFFIRDWYIKPLNCF